MNEPYHLHTHPSSNGWVLRKENATRSWLWFDSKQAALDWAQSIGLGLVVHRKDGSVQGTLRLDK